MSVTSRIDKRHPRGVLYYAMLVSTPGARLLCLLALPVASCSSQPSAPTDVSAPRELGVPTEVSTLLDTSVPSEVSVPNDSLRSEDPSLPEDSSLREDTDALEEIPTELPDASDSATEASGIPDASDSGLEVALPMDACSLSLCAGECVDTRSSPRHCGACDAECVAPARGVPVCTRGACGFTCEPGLHRCGALCASDRDPNTCGASCAPCAAAAHSVSVCDGARCAFTCSAGFGDCDANAANGCEADLNAAPTCGGCSQRCVEPEPLCGALPAGVQGCISGCSGATPTRCGMNCVDLATDPRFCGNCSTACPTVARGRATCAARTCGLACDAGYHLCAGACVSDASTASCGASCGACATPANASSTCDGRSCGFACRAGFHSCSGACVSNSLVSSCGAACTGCAAPTNGAASCDGTRCGITCNTNFHACGSACASDADAGACGTACTVCPTAANAAATCTSGVCRLSCVTGYGDCNGAASDGCETDLRTDAAHCGACRNACPTFGVCAAGLCPSVPATAGRAVIPAFGGDNARSSGNRAERSLTPGNVVSSTFGRDSGFNPSLDADVYAQPLYVPQVLISGARYDVLYAVTQSNAVYALDAQSGRTLWRTTFGVPAVSLSTMYCGNVGPTTGIVGTPVIDTSTWTLFVVAYTTTDGGGSKRFRLHALDVSTGLARPGYPVQISPPAVGASRFDPEYTGERGALSVLGQRVYVPFGGLYGDCGTYHGWVVGIDITNPTRQSAFATPGSGSGVWAPGGFSADSAGRIFIATGNGFTGASRGETVFALDTGSSGPSLNDVSSNYFVPSDHASLDDGDVDLGSIAPAVIEHAGSSTPRLLFQSGKNGVGYLLNRDHLGGQGTGNGITGEGLYSQAIFSGGAFGASATFTDSSGVYVFVSGRGARASPCTGSGGVMTLRLRTVPTGQSAFSPAWCTASASNTSAPTVSSNGSSNAILWVATVSPATLRAYAVTDGREIYASSGADAPSSVRQWVPPVVADGRVYVTGSRTVSMYRLR